MGRKLSERIIKLYRSWQNLASLDSLESAYWVLVDDLCDLPESSVTEFMTRSDVEREIRDILKILSSEKDSYSTYTVAKLSQSLLHLNSEHGKKPTQTDITSRGIPWLIPSLDELEKLRSDTKNLRSQAESHLQDRGVNASDYFTKSLDPVSAGEFLHNDGKYWLQKAESLWGIRAAGIPFDVEVSPLEASFQNLLVTKAGDLNLLLNAKAGPVFTKAHLRFLALHEVVGHVLHFNHMKENQKLQQEAPHLLCIGIHTVDALHVEGIAQILSMALVKGYSGLYPEVECQVSWGNLFMAVRHRNICRLIEGQMTTKEAAVEHIRLMDGDTARIDAVDKMYKERIVDPFACIQGLAYYASLRTYSHYLELSVSEFSKKIDQLMFGFLTSR